ncbi:hypothetical protein BJ944DRAFT_273133 [Cunninghamella echinulata]|nr:hypothetical protein BJ944DRAFT_273133 [Cunninghamella echinulata]
MKIFTIQSKENKKQQKVIHQVPNSFDWIKHWWYRQIYQPPLWCFRAIPNQALTHSSSPSSSSSTSTSWQAFSRHNQIIIWEAARKHIECQITDPSIYNGKEVIRIMVQEEVGFVFNPEWSYPLLYDIALLPVPPIWTWKKYRKSEKQKQTQK